MQLALRGFHVAGPKSPIFHDSTNSPCEGNALAPLALGGGVALAVLLLVLLWARFQPHRNVRPLARLGQRLYAHLSLRPKLKQMLSFYQDCLERMPGDRL